MNTMNRRDFLKRLGGWSAVVGALPLFGGGCTEYDEYEDYGDHDPCDPTYEDAYSDCWEYQEMYGDTYFDYTDTDPEYIDHPYVDYFEGDPQP